MWLLRTEAESGQRPLLNTELVLAAPDESAKAAATPALVPREVSG